VEISRLRDSDRLKSILKRCLRRLGFDLIRYSELRRRTTLAEAFQQLNRVNVRPATVIDVGVAYGTPELYASFPDAAFLLVEPLREWEPNLRELAGKLGGRYELVAAASVPGTVRIRVPEVSGHSTIYPKDGSGLDHGWVEREVPKARLDDLVSNHALEPPYILKVDVEGAELDVLQGAPEVLANSLAVALEVTLIDVFEGGASFAEVVAFMAERGFVIYDVVGGFCRMSDAALYQLDLVFVPKDSRHRKYEGR
jgi:FkbM family methyltransferase